MAAVLVHAVEIIVLRCLHSTSGAVFSHYPNTKLHWIRFMLIDFRTSCSIRGLPWPRKTGHQQLSSKMGERGQGYEYETTGVYGRISARSIAAVKAQRVGPKTTSVA